MNRPPAVSGLFGRLEGTVLVAKYQVNLAWRTRACPTAGRCRPMVEPDASPVGRRSRARHPTAVW